MSTISRKPIRSRLRAVMMMTSTTAIVLACIGFAASDLFHERLSLNNELSMLAEVIGSNSIAALAFGEDDLDLARSDRPRRDGPLRAVTASSIRTARQELRQAVAPWRTAVTDPAGGVTTSV